MTKTTYYRAKEEFRQKARRVDRRENDAWGKKKVLTKLKVPPN